MSDYDGIGYSRCVVCGWLAMTAEETIGLRRCPSCGAEGLPASPKQDVSIRSNIHELRIIGMWAENYANSIEERAPGSLRVVQRILGRIEKQLPEKTNLTFSGEIAEVVDAFPGTEVHGDVPKRDEDLRPPA